jgi:hypothetical protein
MNDKKKPLAPLLHLYLDETGPRHPDRKQDPAAHGFDWFALGGILINAEDEQGAKERHSHLITQWPQIRSPLHLTDIRAEKKGFAWIGKLTDDERTRFRQDFKSFLTSIPVAGTACVIDRPGYAARGYAQRHGNDKWLLCRSAFDIVVERAAKVARMRGRRLRVFYEQADRATDKLMESYFANMKQNGMAFDPSTSEKYQPLTDEECKYFLLSIEGKKKDNRMMQIADAYVYSIARGSYERKFDIYRRLSERGMLITSQVEGRFAHIAGIKTYCFEQFQAAKHNKKGRD